MNLHHASVFLSTLALAAPLPTLAADNPGSHQHGHAQLQMAVDGEHVDVFLVSPAANLVGFEHAPRTNEQRQQVQQLRTWAAGTPMVNTVAGTCTVRQADVHTAWPPSEDMHHHEHDHGHSHEQQEQGHADLEISQMLDCPGLSAETELEAMLMAQFPAMEQLDVQWVGPQGQGGARLTPEQIRFRPGR